MYDTVEIPLPPGIRFSQSVASIKLEVELSRDQMRSVIPFRSNIYYQQVVDLRKTSDIDAVVHFNAKKTGTHKIQIIECGHKCQGQIADTLAQIVDEHPDLLAVSRVDSCVDLVDRSSVAWIAQTVHARCVQWQAQFGTVEMRDQDDHLMNCSWSEMGKREVQTMYLGKRPNCFRVYNKLAERFQQWRKEKWRHQKLAAHIVAQKVTEGIPDVVYTPEAFAATESAMNYQKRRRKELLCGSLYYMPFPTFQDWFAAQCTGPMTNLVQMKPRMEIPGIDEAEQQLPLVPELPKVLTRVERQMAAGRVSPQIDTFEKLFSPAALDFNPFDRLDFPDLANLHVEMNDYTPVEFLAGERIKQVISTGEMTMQHLYRFLDRDHHAKSILNKFTAFVAAAVPPTEHPLSSPELFELYRTSISRQLAA